MNPAEENGDPSLCLIDELLLRWDEARERGEPLTVAELCRDWPGLVEEVQRRIEALGAWEGFVDTTLATGGASSPSAPVPTPGPTIITLALTDLEFHARGGLGAVFRAQDGRLARELAVKFPGGSHGSFSDQELEQRLLREVSVTAALEHPGIVPVYGVGQDANGHPCYAMRFINGKTLRKAIREYHADREGKDTKRVLVQPLRNDVEFRSLLTRFRSACVTVAYAHSRGFLHRDLKPDHILLGDFDVTLVVDWGLTGTWQGGSDRPGGMTGTGRMPETTGTLRTEAGIGTLGYASPEQQAGDWDRVGPASDVFSLGATLYVLLTGSPPFGGESAAEVISKVERGVVVPPRRRNRAIPHVLEAICLRALAPRSEDRYKSAQALADDVERWLADAPVAAFREVWSTRARRWIDRNRTAFSAFLAAAVVATCTLSAGWHFYRLHVLGLRSLAYATAEKTAREHVLTQRAGWVTEGLAQLGRAARIATPLQSTSALRSLAISCLGGVDLQSRGSITPLPAGCLAFSPDGALLAVGELFGVHEYCIQLLDVRSRRLIWRHAISTRGDAAHRSGVSSIGFSPDGRRLAAGLRNGKTLIWDSIGDTGPLEAPGRNENRVIGLGFSADGGTLVSGSEDGVILLRDRTDEGGWVESRRVAAARSLSDLAMSPDRTHVVQVGDGRSARYYLKALREGPPPSPLATLQQAGIGRVAVSPDGRTTAVSAESSRMLMVGEDPSPNLLVDPDIGVAHQDETDRLEFSPDGALLASGSADNTVKLWDMASMRMVLRQPVFSESMVIPTFHPGGRMLAVGSTEGVLLYDVLGVDIHSTRANGSEPLTDFAFLDSENPHAPNLLTFRTLARERTKGKRILELWSDSSTRPLREREFSVNPGMWGDEPLRLDAESRTHQGFFQSFDKLHVFDLDSPTLTEQVMDIEQAGPFRFSPDGKRLWGVLRGESVESWELPGLTRQTSWTDRAPPEPKGRVAITCLAAGNRWVLAGTLAGRFLMLKPTEGTPQYEGRVSGPIQSLAMNPDGSLAACGTQRGGLDLVRLSPGVPVIHIAAHTEMITGLAFHPAGHLLVTSSRDGFLAFWRVGESVVELARIRASHGGSARMIRFSADGRYLGVLFPNHRAVRLWDLDRLRARLGAVGLDWDDRA